MLPPTEAQQSLHRLIVNMTGQCWIFTWITCSSCLLLVEHLDALGTGTETQLCSPSGRQLLQVKTFFSALKKTISITCTVCPRNLVHLLWLYYKKSYKFSWTYYASYTYYTIHTKNLEKLPLRLEIELNFWGKWYFILSFQVWRFYRNKQRSVSLTVTEHC